jgi:hypothetical protein
VVSSLTVGRSTPASGESTPTKVGGTSLGLAAEEASTGEMDMMGLGAAAAVSGFVTAAEGAGSGSWGSDGLVSGV